MESFAAVTFCESVMLYPLSAFSIPFTVRPDTVAAVAAAPVNMSTTMPTARLRAVSTFTTAVSDAAPLSVHSLPEPSP